MPERFSFLLALLAFLLGGLALYRSFTPPAPASPGPHTAADDVTAADDEEEESGELAPHMAALQRHAEKLYHAGARANWPLARFYSHELDEAAEEIEDGAFVAGGQPLGPLVARWLLPAVERTEDAAADEDRAAFDAAYADLVAACNACHAATDHGFVKITAPQANAFTNQDFAP